LLKREEQKLYKTMHYLVTQSYKTKT